MAKAKYATQRTGTGTACVTFDEPQDPLLVSLWNLVPYDGRIKSMKIEYIRITEEVAAAERAESSRKAKRHIAAVKANATRKAKKEAKQP